MIVLQRHERGGQPCALMLSCEDLSSCVPGCRPQEPPLDLFCLAIQGEFPRDAQPAFDEALAEGRIHGELLDSKRQAACFSRCVP